MTAGISSSPLHRISGYREWLDMNRHSVSVCLFDGELHLTSPARLGRPPTEEATELTELMEELLGLWASEETPIATRLLFLALAGLVEGKPMRITLWIGANRPNLGRH